LSNGQYRRVSGVKRLAIVASAALCAGLLLAPSPGTADPGRQSSSTAPLTIAEAQHQLSVLNREAEIASEAYNTVKVHMQASAKRLTGMQADLKRQRTRVLALRNEIVGTALSDYRSGGGLSTSASFLTAKRPSEFINALATSAIVQRQQTSLLTQFSQQRNQLGVQEQQASRELAAIAADKQQMAKHKAVVDQKIKQTQELLGRLKAKQRARLLALQAAQAQAQTTVTQTSRDTQRPPTQSTSPSQPTPPQQQLPAPPSSGRAAVAVQTALAQLGKPYVYGAAGPDAFDCSGLTMYSWAAAGVSLSHASSVQSGQGVPVSISALQPGDLVFYYSPVSHVGMYIGNGQVVHAPHPGSVVEIVPLYSMPISWARRVG